MWILLVGLLFAMAALAYMFLQVATSSSKGRMAQWLARHEDVALSLLALLAIACVVASLIGAIVLNIARCGS